MRRRADLAGAKTSSASSPLSYPALLFATLAGLALSWPALLNGTPFVFADTGSYLRQGAAVINLVLDMLPGDVLETSPGVGGDDAVANSSSGFDALNSRADVLRSLPYAVFAHLTSSTPLGLFGVVFAQGALTALAVWPLVAGVVLTRPLAASLAAVGLVLLTPAAWYASYLMPDILGASVVAFALILVAAADRIDWTGRVALAALAAFGVAAHYGNILLAMAAVGTALALRLLRGRLTFGIAALGVAPIATVIVFNLLVGAAATKGGEVTATPLRLPLMLARSIQDGPARWHLERACPEQRYAVCEAFDGRIPDNVHSAMWGPRGLSNAGRDMLDRIRREELTILWRAFLEHPAAQIRSLGGNAAEQFFDIGLNEMDAPARRSLGVMMTGAHVTALAALAAGLIAGWRLGAWAQADIATVLLVALTANAIVFGGLSAPVDRYQSRIAWLAPMVAAVIWVALVARRRANKVSPAPRRDAPAFGSSTSD